MKAIAAIFAATIALALSACNTVQGVGQDIQKGGQVLEDAAKKK
ncbi:entericidin A/B family lipoprotein [Hydrogenophaga sp.]|jgi:predicted small secreted protein|nr:entericidin A/B family lipoprotein [Hydrogenophaga sp.]MDM7948160.1 entericidin A/B family lipoprotein [Hydrogenophaga sp.]